MTDDPLYHQARRLIAQLELVSHAPTKNYDSDGRGSSEDPGGTRPPTGHHRAPKDDLGTRELDDHEPAYLPLRRRLHRATVDHDLELIIRDATRELKLARRSPPPPNPEKGTVAWKRAIANSDKSPTEIARLFDVSRKHVYELREKYRDEKAA